MKMFLQLFVAQKNNELSSYTYLCANKVQFFQALIFYDSLLVGWS